MPGLNITVPWSNGVTYGRGFESLTGTVRGFPLNPSEPTEVKNAGGQRVMYYLNKVESMTELKTQLGLSAEVNARFGLFGASAKLDYAESASFNSFSVFLVARVQVTNAFKTLEDAAFDAQAWELLETAEGRKKFATQFGDSFVSGLSTGGEFCAVLELRTENSADQKSLSSSLSGSYGLAASADVEFSKKIQRATENRFLKISMYQAGGIGSETTNDVNEVLQRAKAFAALVRDHPVPYEAQIVDYDTLDRPAGETWVDQDRAMTVLKQFAAQKDRLLRLLNDINFVRDNMEQFESPDMTTLNDAASDIADRLNRLTDNARQAVRNAEKAEYIDVGMPLFEMPKRAQGVMVEVVNLVGLRLSTVRAILQNPHRSRSEFNAWAEGHHEAGTVAIKPPEKMYEFLRSGVKFTGEYVSEFAHIGAQQVDFTEPIMSMRAFWSWVTKQEPAGGQIAPDGTVALTFERKGAGYPPPELRPIWGL